MGAGSPRHGDLHRMVRTVGNDGVVNPEASLPSVALLARADRAPVSNRCWSPQRAPLPRLTYRARSESDYEIQAVAVGTCLEKWFCETWGKRASWTVSGRIPAAVGRSACPPVNGIAQHDMPLGGSERTESDKRIRQSSTCNAWTGAAATPGICRWFNRACQAIKLGIKWLASERRRRLRDTC